ncbi:MAG: DEAD/DEAH box helicase [Bacteroidota bacterium]|nr:DEAD/DEAH box helicase [Bacteroidota bacterium]
MLKKLNPKLEQTLIELQFNVPLPLQKETFSLYKSGLNLLIDAPQNAGKTFSIALNCIHKLDTPFEQSPRALIIVANKDEVLHLTELTEALNKHNKLRIFQTYEQTDIDQDKNLISEGIDILIGTPKKINDLFTRAGFDINQLKLLAIDNIDSIIKNRQENLINRIIDSCPRTQFIITTKTSDNKVERFVERNFEDIEYYKFEE